MSTFSHIILTAPNIQTSDVYLKELESLREHLICLQSCEIYSTSDPYGQRVGSGGGTLNALDYLVHNICNTDIINAKVVVINSGGDSKRSPLHSICGKAWSTINVDINQTTYSSPMSFLIKELCEFCRNIPKGSVVVACSDVILDIFHINQSFNFHPDGITIVTVPEIPEIAKNHGVIVPSVEKNNNDEYHYAKSYLQKPSIQKMNENNAFLPTPSVEAAEKKVLVDTGVVIITGKAYQCYLELLKNPIIQKCTTTGLESVSESQRSQECLRLELYSDMLLPLIFTQDNSNDDSPCTLEAFYNRLGLLFPTNNNTLYNNALQIIWASLNSIPLLYTPVLNGMFSHLGTTLEFLQLLNNNHSSPSNNNNNKTFNDNKNKYDIHKMEIISKKYNFQKYLHVKYQNNNSSNNYNDDNIIGGGVIVNSIIEMNHSNSISSTSLIEHSQLHGNNISIGDGAVVSQITDTVGKDLVVLPGIMMQLVPIRPCYWHLLSSSFDDSKAANAEVMTSSSTGSVIMTESVSLAVMDDSILSVTRMAVLVILSVEDNMKLHYRDTGATVCGVSWSTFFNITGTTVESLWTEDIEDTDRTLWNAKLFQLFHSSKLSTNPKENMYLFWLQLLSTHTTDTHSHPHTNLASSTYKDIIRKWQGSPRVSLSELLSPGYADAVAMHTWRKTLIKYTCSESSSNTNNSHHGSNKYDKIWKTYEWVEELRGSMECLAHQPLSQSQSQSLSRKETSQLCLYCWFLSLIYEIEVDSIQGKIMLSNALRVIIHKNRILKPVTATFTDHILQSIVDLFLIKWKAMSTSSSQSNSTSSTTTTTTQFCSTNTISSPQSDKRPILLSIIDPQLVLSLLLDDLSSDSIGCVFMSILEHIRVRHEDGDTILSTSIPRVLLILSWLAEIDKIPGSYQLATTLLSSILTTPMKNANATATITGNTSLLNEIKDNNVEQQQREDAKPVNTLSLFYEILMQLEYEMQPLLLKFKTTSNSNCNNIAVGLVPLHLQLDTLCQQFISYHVQKSLEFHLNNFTTTTTTTTTTTLHPQSEISTESVYTGNQESTPVATFSPTVTDGISLCQCPIRIDLAGGWSDTPPICYQSLGGAVLNVAVRVNNKRPVACASKFLSTPIIRLISVMRVNSTDTDTDTEKSTIAYKSSTYCFEKEEVICNVIPETAITSLLPTEKCALLKACLLALGWNNSNQNNRSFLPKAHLGLEVVSCSTLPPGSGLGGSSILAAAILRSVSNLLQLQVTTEKTVYLVSYVEQLLTTGGGWQDQVGGVYPGFKIARSPARLPLRVVVEQIICSKELIKSFNSRVYLLYTGTQRLAKNTLMNALKGFATSPLFPSVVSSLIQEANIAAEDLLQAKRRGDDPDDIIDRLATIINNYWSLKCQMAEGSEPKHIKALLERIRPLTVGLSLCGAGAGGYAVVVLSRYSNSTELSTLITSINTELTMTYLVDDTTTMTPTTTNTFTTATTAATTTITKPSVIWFESVQLDQEVTDFAEIIPNISVADIPSYLIDLMTP